MTYTRHTGGAKEFRYTDEDLKRIESEDTESTRDFKNALRHHRNRKGMREYYKGKKIPHYHREYVGKRPLEEEPKKQKTNFFIILLILGIVGLFVLYQEGYFDDYISLIEEKGTIKGEKIKPVIVEEKISFQEYLENYENYDGKRVTLTGFLSRGIQELGTGGVYVESIVDDYGNDIKLIHMSKEFISKLPKTGITNDLYNVTGYFEKIYMGLNLKPTKIVKTERNKKVIEEEEIKEIVSIGSDKQISFNFDFDKLFNDIKDKIDISCKENERWYMGQCIPRIECSDGTLHPSCSSDKPKQCVNGELINNVSKCGCEWDEVERENECISKNIIESQEATEYINQLREKYGRSELKWTEDIYNLALLRAKDMYDRSYFDHVTPEGKCVKDYASQYGLSSYNIAENAGAVAYSFSDTNNIDYAGYADPIEQVDSWMESRGHRYNLLYPSHEIGAVVCYKGACIFLGGNKEYYGLGYGPCTTGAEGLAYWESVSKQEGEI